MEKSSNRLKFVFACVIVIALGSSAYLYFRTPAGLNAVAKELRDPQSAIFKNVQELAGGQAYCGEVNGRNSFGAMAGWTEFMAYRLGDGPEWRVNFESGYSCDYDSWTDAANDAVMVQLNLANQAASDGLKLLEGNGANLD